jgi:hypothetical protein
MVKVIKTILLLVVTFAPNTLVAQEQKSCIRNIDFKNQEYILHDELTTGDERLLVKNGRYEKASEKVGFPPNLFFVVDKIVFGDLTGDGKDEAIVFAAYGSGAGNYMVSIIYVFGCENGRLELLASLKQEDVERVNHLMVYFPDDPSIRIKNNILYVTYLTDGSHHNPTNRITFGYRLKKSQLVLTGKIIKRKNAV